MQKIGIIFPGQGSQSIGMGRSFVEHSAEAKALVQAASVRLGFDFEALLFEENERINETAYTQPAILLVSMMAYTLFQQAKPIIPSLFLGHSLGEFSAIAAAGAIDVIDAVALVHRRGALMQSACDGVDAGMMVLLGLDDAKVEALCAEALREGKKVWPANYNQEGQIVVAGLKSDLVAMESVFKAAGAKRAMLLNMSVASHCPLLSQAQAPLRAEMESLLRDSFCAPVISNVTAQPYQSKAEALELLSDQLIKPVRYKHSIAAVAPQLDLMIEFGNGKVLSGLNRKIAPECETLNVFDMESLEKALQALS
ncbi:MAG: ACP S-malonyltransferase [Campylobacterales bacterium]|nr:ACP S-malonyltransferase [Campylobacterales bacterium]